MKIGVLTTSFPRFDGDVAGCFVLGCCRALAERGHTLEVLAPEPRRPSTPPRWPGVEVVWVPYLRPRAFERTFYGAGVPENLRRAPWGAAGLGTFTAALYREGARRVAGWDALMSHWALPAGLLGGALAGPRAHLAVCHSADVHALERLPGGPRLARRVADGATAMLFVSNELRQRFAAMVPGLDRRTRVHVAPMGIDAPVAPATSRAELRRALGLERFTVLSLGRLVPIKGLDTALAATALLDGAELVIAGDGPERRHLEAEARRRGARVRFVGTITGDAKRAWLAAADAFVLASAPRPSGRREGLPTALLEAMAAGLPVVATAQGGVPELVDDGRSGLLVPPGDPRAMARALARLRDEPEAAARLARAGRDAAAPYTWPRLAPMFEALLA